MPNDDDEQPPLWQNLVDRAILRATCTGRPFSAETLLDNVGLVSCPMTLNYVRRRLSAIGGANQATVTDADTLRPWDDIAREDRIDAAVAVIFSDIDSLGDEEKVKALNTVRTWRVLKEMFQRNELRKLLIEEQRKFLREHGGGR